MTRPPPETVRSWDMHIGFFTFAGLCLIATVFFWRFAQESKGKSLEDRERLWKQDWKLSAFGIEPSA